MKKRYGRPKLQSQEIKLQKGKVDGCVDMCIFYGDDVPGCDRALIIYYLCSNNINYKGGEIKSLLYDMYEAEKGNKEELKKPVPDSWLEKIANDETLSDEGLKFLAKKLEKQGFVSIEDSYKWIQIEEDIAKKKLEDLNKEINLNKTGAISLLNRVKNTKSLNISFDETFQKIQEVKKNLDFNKFDSVLNNIKSLNKYFKK